eukprot:TRINITY_DN4534_c0_g1_i2.p1 TRINITY_DN4534_c0_g1~~TRINITY_DN4534_c0_g1_i2.p1  ORF type:complete len:356 (-),score=101.74 TRINITY_DN4534_c0_g1_i2:155-1222(-)
MQMQMWVREDSNKMLLGGAGTAPGQAQGHMDAMTMGLGVMPPHPHPQHPLQLNPSISGGIESHHVMLGNIGGNLAVAGNNNNNMGNITAAVMAASKKDDRIPQWSLEETKEFIAIRAELEKEFTHTKRNKTLWENVSARMRDKGYKRSSDQCKCKWKNLVNRYKGKETSDPETGKQCPFFDELDAIFKERAKNLQRMMDSEGGGSQPKKKMKRLKASQGEKSSDDYSDEDEENDEDSEDERAIKSRKRKSDRERQRTTAEKGRANNMQEVLQDFFQQQQRIEMQWRESVERREQERRLAEQEWRRNVEKLAHEHFLMEQTWRQREEQRRMREEGRAEKIDALLNTLLNRLTREDP